MTPVRKLFSFAIDPDLAEGLRLVEQRDGIPMSEQIRRAIRAALTAKGVLGPAPPNLQKTARKRAGTRKRA
jgi:hypothetical protein